MKPTNTTPHELDQVIEDRPEFTPAQRDALRDYGIETVGDLLGATRGLTQLEPLRAIRADLAITAVGLRVALSEELLEPFVRDDAPFPAMGWIPEGGDR